MIEVNLEKQPDINISLEKQGPRGLGIIGGGLTGQALLKLSNDDYDVYWGAIEGAGDMLKVVYDPNLIGGDVFDMDNMVQGATKKFISADELAVLQATSGINTGDQDLSGYATETWVGEQGFITGTPWESEGYLKDITSKSIGDLEDVDLTDIDNGKILKYNSTSEKWECEDDAGGMENPMTTAGDIIYGGASGTPTRLGKGTDGQVLKLASGVPSWADTSSVDATQTLTDGATISWNMDDGNCGIVTLEGNRTLSNPTNVNAGSKYRLIVKQDTTGSRTLDYGSNFKFPGDVTPVLSATANAVDILEFLAESSSILHLTNFISDSK